MDTAQTELATADKDGLEKHAKPQPACTIATTMENALTENAIAELDLPGRIVPSEHAHPTATTTDNVSTSLANATKVGPDSTAL